MVDEVNPYIQEVYSIRDEIIELIKVYEGDLSSEFNELINGNPECLKKPNRKEWYENIYDAIYELVPEKSTGFTNWGGLSLPRLNFLTPDITNVQNYREKVKERDHLKNDLVVLNVQKDEQKKILGDYGKPIGLWSGLLVLVYACLVGIVYPSTLLPYSIGVYNDINTKWLILGLFFSELMALFLYLALTMYKLTRINRE